MFLPLPETKNKSNFCQHTHTKNLNCISWLWIWWPHFKMGLDITSIYFPKLYYWLKSTTKKNTIWLKTQSCIMYLVIKDIYFQIHNINLSLTKSWGDDLEDNRTCWTAGGPEIGLMWKTKDGHRQVSNPRAGAAETRTKLDGLQAHSRLNEVPTQTRGKVLH